MNKLLKVLLWPIAMLYGMGMCLRNIMFDLGLLPSYKVPIPTIVVGNLKVGGTGKTPFVEFLISHFLEEKKTIGVLSRGYGRKTSGFREADTNCTSDEVGDEPFQYYSKYSKVGVRVFVGEDRVKAILSIHLQYPDIDIILLDDAFQHRRLRADKYLLLTEQSQPFYSDYVMPMGWLREFRSGAIRSDCVCVTKSPPRFNERDAQRNKKRIDTFTPPNTPVYFTRINYLEAVPMIKGDTDTNLPANIVLLSGIANANPFISYCRQRFNIKEVFEFPDHHDYSEQEIKRIVNCVISYKEPVAIVTTEKDKSRLLKFIHIMESISLFYIPIEVEFLFDTKEEIRAKLRSWF